MKLRAVVLALLVLSFAAPSHADRTRAQVAPTPALAEIEPALYVVRDADSTIYLFGTIHVRRPGSHWGGLNARNALTQAEEVWLELDMAENADEQALALVTQFGMAPADQPLSSILTPEEYQRLREITKELGLPLAMFDAMQPWLAAITLSMMPMMQSGYESEAGADSMIEAEAIANGQQRRAFETMAQQIGFFADLPMDVQRQMLVDALSETYAPPEDVDVLSVAWEQGDVETLERYVIDDMRTQYPTVYQVLIVQRNAAWMDVLMRELEGAGVDFVAVGAGHLLGADGLVEMFRARGLEVERVAPVVP